MTSRRTGVSNACKTSDNDSNPLMERWQDFKTEKPKTNIQKEQNGKEENQMSEHIETRKKLKNIADISSFESLLNMTTLSDTDKQLLKLFYIHGKNLQYIGDMLGYSESTIKKKHRKILKKLSRVL